MKPNHLHLKIQLPSRIFAELSDVTRIVADSQNGSFGLLPHRRDCVAALSPSIFMYATDAHGEVYMAVDEGVLVKTGNEVLVSVRNAVAGADLGKLKQAIQEQFLKMDEQEATLRNAVAKLELGVLRQLVGFLHA
jgi:F-type H+-transporting ATPase subunit epsilon